MMEAHPLCLGSETGRTEDGSVGTRRLAGWLALAATPTFLAMAVLTGSGAGGPMDGVCSAAVGFPLGGMAPMYLLMSAFHASPWLELIRDRRRRGATSRAPSRAARPADGR